jgi:hypothetical protein
MDATARKQEPMVAFPTAARWEAWLDKNHTKSRTPEIRARRMAKMLEMLAKGEKFHP